MFHTAYTFEQIRSSGLEIFIKARDLGEFFSHVYTVNPIADLQYKHKERIKNAKPAEFELDARNTIIEGRTFPISSRFRILRAFWLILNQIRLIAFVIKKVPLRSIVLVRGENALYAGAYALLFSCALRVPYLIGSWGNPNRLRTSSKRPMMPNLSPSVEFEILIEKRVLRYSKFALAQNEENRGYLFDMGVPKEKSVLLPLEIGIDASHFIEPEMRSVPSEIESLKSIGVPILVCISRLEPEKNVDHAIMACGLLKDKNIGFKLFIFGDGRMRSDLESLVSHLNISNQVEFMGNKSQEFIAQFLAQTSINIAPLCGRSLLEASLAGCPSVAYDVDWHSDIVTTGKTGVLVQNLDIQGLSNGLQRLIQNPNLKSELGRNVRERALSRSGPDILSLKLNSIYQSALDN